MAPINKLTGEIVDTTESEGEQATQRTTDHTHRYRCAACLGQLKFDSHEQTLRCPDCGRRRGIVDGGGPVADAQDFRAAMTAMHGEAEQTGPQLTGEKEVVCRGCGGHTTFSGTLASVRCPYCLTPIQRDDVHEAPGRRRVDGVVPFAIDAVVVKTSVEAWISGRWFAPSEFKRYKQTGSFASVYAAYFSYEADASTAYRGRRGDEYSITVGSGRTQHEETRVRWRDASGTVRTKFEDVCVLANDGLERDKVAALEPWPTELAEPDAAESIAGHLCRTYDHDVEESFAEAKHRMDGDIEATVRREIGGDHQDLDVMETAFDPLTFKHLLAPIWLLTVMFNQRPFQVLMNGVTGEIHGQRPWSRVKIAIAVTAPLLLIAAIAGLLAASR